MVLQSGSWCYTVLRLCYRLLHGVDIVLQGVIRCYMVLQGVDLVLQGVTVLHSGIWCYTVLTQGYRVVQSGTGCHVWR